MWSQVSSRSSRLVFTALSSDVSSFCGDKEEEEEEEQDDDDDDIAGLLGIGSDIKERHQRADRDVACFCRER